MSWYHINNWYNWILTISIIKINLKKEKIMCITVDKAKMTATIVGGAVNYKSKTHILLYQNNVQNLSGKANALVLPIMGKVVKVQDTSSFNSFMNEIVEQTTPVAKAASISRSMKSSVKVYQVGAYTILEAENATVIAIIRAINKLQPEQRPAMTDALLAWYKEHYGNPTLLLCCFTGKDTLRSQPIMVEYVPRNFNSFLVPGADDHHGNTPKLGFQTDREHKLIFGQVKKPILVMGGNTVKFSQDVPKSLQNGIWDTTILPEIGNNCDWVYVMDPTNFTWSVKEVTTKKEIAALFWCVM